MSSMGVLTRGESDSGGRVDGGIDIGAGELHTLR